MGLSVRKAAAELGLTHPALLKAARTGRVSIEPDGTYDVEKIRKQLASNTNQAKRRKTAAEKKSGNPNSNPNSLVTKVVTTEEPVTTESEDGTFHEAQRRREWLRVKKDELELARKRGEMAPIGEINAWIVAMIVRARDLLLRIPSELKDRLAQDSNPLRCEQLLLGEVHRVLNELAEFKQSV